MLFRYPIIDIFENYRYFLCWKANAVYSGTSIIATAIIVKISIIATFCCWPKFNIQSNRPRLLQNLDFCNNLLLTDPLQLSMFYCTGIHRTYLWLWFVMENNKFWATVPDKLLCPHSTIYNNCIILFAINAFIVIF